MKKIKIIISILFLITLCKSNVVLADNDIKDGPCEPPVMMYNNKRYEGIDLALKKLDNKFEYVGTIQYHETFKSFDPKDKLVTNIELYKDKKAYVRKNEKNFIFIEQVRDQQVFYEMLETKEGD